MRYRVSHLRHARRASCSRIGTASAAPAASTPSPSATTRASPRPRAGSASACRCHHRDSSPSRPGYELAISANIDTIVRPEDVTITDQEVVFNPQTNTVSLREGAVQDALSKGVDVGVSVPMRVGLETAVHLGKNVDLNLYGMLSTLGGAFSGDSVKTVGGALLIRWDDIVPAVLPKPEVEVHESCEATERRFRACPNSRHCGAHNDFSFRTGRCAASSRRARRLQQQLPDSRGARYSYAVRPVIIIAQKSRVTNPLMRKPGICSQFVP
jgi:hypothetical protein